MTFWSTATTYHRTVGSSWWPTMTLYSSWLFSTTLTITATLLVSFNFMSFSISHQHFSIRCHPIIWLCYSVYVLMISFDLLVMFWMSWYSYNLCLFLVKFWLWIRGAILTTPYFITTCTLGKTKLHLIIASMFLHCSKEDLFWWWRGRNNMFLS